MPTSDSSQDPSNTLPRRKFVQTSAAATLAGVVGLPHISRAADAVKNKELKIGLIGCGGRGTGAASQALAADPNVKLWAMGDVFAQQVETSHKNLVQKYAGKMDVPATRRHVGLDAYQKVINSGVDIVLLATPPGFRPQHLAAAVEAGKNVFSEKPMAVDMAGVKSVLESAKLAKSKGVSIQHGFCWRFAPAVRAAYEKVHSGELGRVISVYGNYLAAVPKPMMASKNRDAKWSDVEWQIRNWIGHEWLSGGPLVEQAVHTVDKVAWAMNDVAPIAAVATGGRIQRNDDGDIYDHYSIAYEYPNGVICHLDQRQLTGSHTEVVDRVFCEKGRMIGPGRPMIYNASGKATWRFRGKKINMYQACHNEFFASLREGKVINAGEYMANSTALALLGREAAHTGKRITWDKLMASNDDMAADEIKWGDSLDPSKVPVPGRA
ncbi:dehydrogenase [Oceaniferula spumae]|uniref:Dehydrogenase n=1 Tax=Oceaniferula spumae TaxID=2979115 RepID=A0AAT9FIM6_9BACT